VCVYYVNRYYYYEHSLPPSHTHTLTPSHTHSQCSVSAAVALLQYPVGCSGRTESFLHPSIVPDLVKGRQVIEGWTNQTNTVLQLTDELLYLSSVCEWAQRCLPHPCTVSHATQTTAATGCLWIIAILLCPSCKLHAPPLRERESERE
jgi:hypothetical protein